MLSLCFACALTSALVAMPDTRRHVKLRKPLAEYAAEFGVSVATLKYWIRRGKEHDHAVPLDEPERFPDWWHGCMSGPVPSRFRVAASAPMISDGNGASSSSEKRWAGVEGLDFEGNVKALRRTLAINGRLLEEASQTNDEQLYNLRQRMYQSAFNDLRRGERSLVELQKLRGQLIDRDQVESEATKVVETLRLMRESMPQRVLSHLSGVSSELADWLTKAITSEREAEDKIFRNLKLEGVAEEELTRLGLSGQNEGEKQ
jgi:hypothetical protein